MTISKTDTMTYDTRIITELREAINRAENMIPFMRQDMIQLLEGAKCEIETLAANLKQMQNERDEARRLHCRMSAQFVYLSGELCTAKFVANEKGWDCFKEEPRWNSDPNIISLDELARCTRNQTP